MLYVVFYVKSSNRRFLDQAAGFNEKFLILLAFKNDNLRLITHVMLYTMKLLSLLFAIST